MGTDKPLNDLHALRWKNRILLVQADETMADAVKQAYLEHAAGIAARDIVWFILVEGMIETNYPGPIDEGFADWVARTHFQDPSEPLNVVLIGKDGGVKSRSGDFSPGPFFALIDSMPMRIDEMRKKQ